MQALEEFNILPRDSCVETIASIIDRETLVFVIGVRRSGKSCVATQLEAELQRKHLDSARVARYNLETIAAAYLTANDLISYFDKNYDPDKPNYILLDEITHVREWKRVINHISRHENCHLVLFSSNQRIVSQELSAVRENKYGIVHMFPLSLPEFIRFQGFQEITRGDELFGNKLYKRFDGGTYTLKDIYEIYITYGGLPILKPEYMDRERAWVIMDGSYGAVVTHDVLELGTGEEGSAVTDTLLLRSVITIMAKSVGDNISATWIGKQTAEYLRRPSSTKTIESYMRALINAHLFYTAERFDIKAEKAMKTLAKYYMVDTGLRNYITGVRAEDENRLLENEVFFELLRRGYQVYNGKLGREEITLLAIKGQTKAYIQVAGKLGWDGMRDLVSPLRRIRDYHPKIIISFEQKTQTLADGIIILNAIDLLMGGVW